jgi:endonuclease YncB( thermonuclease family)
MAPRWIGLSVFAAMLATAAATHAGAQESAPTNAELHALMKPEQHQVLVEFYDRERKRVKLETFNQATPFVGGSGVSFGIGQGRSIALYGIAPCAKATPINDGGDAMPCNEAAGRVLTRYLRNAPVTLCRASSGVIDRPVIPATCYAYVYRPPGLVGVSALEDELVGVGYAVLQLDAAGKPLRPDLVKAAETARAMKRGAFEE